MALLDLNSKLRLLSLKSKIDNLLSNGPVHEMDDQILVLSHKLPLNTGRRKLTKKQSAILEFVIEYTAKTGIPPTRAEISNFFGFKSCNAAQEHLKALEKKRYIALSTGFSRAIKIS